MCSGYTHFEVYPQPGTLAWAVLSLPTVQGIIKLRFNQTSSVFDAQLTVPGGSTARVCLPPPTITAAGGSKQQQGPLGLAAPGKLTVDGVPVRGVAEGRMLCAPANITAGSHQIVRR